MAKTSTNIGEELAEAPKAGLSGFTSERSPWRLVTLSMLMLFVELALIRWTAANNVHLANITNFVLLASFLGIGVGFLLAGWRHETCSGWRQCRLAVLVAFALIFPVKLVALHGPHEFQGISGHCSFVPVGEPSGHLRAGGPGDGGTRTGDGPDLRPLRAARRLPPRHHRQRRRDRPVLGPVLHRASAHRLGCGGGRRVRAASRQSANGGGSGARSLPSW